MMVILICWFIQCFRLLLNKRRYICLKIAFLKGCVKKHTLPPGTQSQIMEIIQWKLSKGLINT